MSKVFESSNIPGEYWFELAADASDHSEELEVAADDDVAAAWDDIALEDDEVDNICDVVCVVALVESPGNKYCICLVSIWWRQYWTKNNRLWLLPKPRSQAKDCGRVIPGTRPKKCYQIKRKKNLLNVVVAHIPSSSTLQRKFPKIMMSPHTTATHPCTAHLARQTRPQSDSSWRIQNGTTLYYYSLVWFFCN